MADRPESARTAAARTHSDVPSPVPISMTSFPSDTMFSPPLFGIPLGISAAVHRNRFVDYFNRVFSLIGLSVPAFYLGILLILVFSVKLRLLPVVGGGEFWDLEDNLTHVALPALALGNDHDGLRQGIDLLLDPGHPA